MDNGVVWGSLVMSVEQVEAKSPSADEVTPRKRSIWGRLVGVVIFIALVLAVIAGIRKGQKDKAAEIQPPVTPTIQTATARRGSIGFYVQALGTVTPLASVNLYSQVNGRVMTVNFREGQMVHRGESLIDIDPRPYEAQLKQAEGTLQHDRGLLAQAEMDFARYKDAADQQAIARQTYEDQEHVVEQYKGTVQNDVGQVEYAQVQLSYCHLASPIDGRVGLRLVDPGNTVFSGASNPIVVVTQLAPISIVFNVAEDDLVQVRSEITHRGSLPVDAFDRTQLVKLATGRLLTLDNQIDTSTGTLRFRGQFDNKDLKLYPNQFVNARMLVKTLQDAILIPTAAVQRNGTQAYVYVLQGDTAKLRQVVQLTTENDLAAVTGLNEGDVVSTTGFEKLQDGTKVKVQSSKGTPVAGTQPAANQIGSAL
jgi:multidrug efflux system membrane fusion protein